MDRDSVTRQWAGGDTVIVVKRFLSTGQADSVASRSSPDAAAIGVVPHAFSYDFRGRVLAERQKVNTITYSYDPAGNLLSGGRNPATVTYDALNRPDRKTIGSDSSRFVYDEQSQLRLAFNDVARVARTWARNGTLVTDSLRIANQRLNERVFTANVFGLGMAYDLNLRRTTLTFPATVMASATQRYVYTSDAGLLDTVEDVFGKKYRFSYDFDARPSRLTRLAGQVDSIFETFDYDSLARLARRRQVRAAGTDSSSLHRDSLTYDRRDKLIGNVWTNDAPHYTPLGYLDTVSYGSGAYEAYRLDAMGHRVYGNDQAALNGTATYTYVANTERIDKLVVASQSPTSVSGDTTIYDWSSNGTLPTTTKRKLYQTCFGCSPFTSHQRITNSNNYDAGWRLTSNYYQLDTVPAPGGQYRSYTRTETYRYDPLGRRIWKRMIRDTAQAVCNTHDKYSGCRNEVTRSVWDGAQLLVDVRMTADTTGDASEGYPSAGTWTGMVGYIHAGGIDQPLALFKGTTLVLPYSDWRGSYDKATCSSTLCGSSVYLPLANATLFSDAPLLLGGPPNWFGELLSDQADGSGLHYKRNRYYDPSSGQFTQEDPIGLAGGLNAYGFASSDPVAFADPFGLCPTCGDEAVEFHASVATSPSSSALARSSANVGLAVASLWTSDTWGKTALTLAGGGAASLGIRFAAGAAVPATVAAATAGGLPVAVSAVPKLATLAQRFGTTADALVKTAVSTGQRFVDMANRGNINALIPRPDGASGFIRVTPDPTGQNVISAGLMRANQVANGVASGRLVPMP
ncbi:MAG: RHS repeat-associated core domain-containing protein [Gemmatimonadetes bacterium]|nr:RHS repeat-associated core domain-containing protein [Gemmatimonadota bacterium]